MSEDLVFKVLFGGLFGIVAVALLIWCLMWFLNMLDELFDGIGWVFESKTNFIVTLICITLVAVIGYLVVR
tara:strand:+ start:334 stop:546 length:213 start_codon:yes stop_codon:yes gene_type:complete